MKGHYCFRLGTTSYILPDEILPNVRFLADKVDDIELVLFESGDLSNIPSAETVQELKQVALDHDLTYTVHLPIDIHTGRAEESERRRAVETCRRIIDRLEPAAPFAYILHLACDRRDAEPPTDLARWQALHRDSVSRLLDLVVPERLCIENLGYAFVRVAGIVTDLRLAICCDIGHLLLYGVEVDAHLDRYLAPTRVIHLHGLAGGVDHRAVSCLDPAFLEGLMQRLRAAAALTRVVTMEVFGEDDFQSSLQCLAKWGHAQGGNT